MKLENDLRSDPIRPLVLRIAIPSMLAQFVSVLYSVVDRMYIGNIAQVGSLALAGAGVCGPIVTMLGSVAFWVGELCKSPLVFSQRLLLTRNLLNSNVFSVSFSYYHGRSQLLLLS